MTRSRYAYIALLALGATLAFADPTSPAAPVPSASDLYAKGYKASQSGRFDEAIGDFRAAIEIKANYAEAYNMLGFSLRKSGKVDEAFQDYEKALQLKPNFPEAREYYGEAFLMKNDLKDAVRQYLALQKSGKAQAKELLEKIDEYLVANPGA